jgi:hypothetical protein
MPHLLESVSLVTSHFSVLQRQDVELTQRINAKTFHQIRNLKIVRDADRVIVVGRTLSYYVKQLATHAALELFPGEVIDNAIDVVGVAGHSVP